jgi:hypothetical protein
MENHPPSCIYYYCADIRIVAGGAVPAEGDGGAGTPGTGTPVDASVALPPTGTQSDAAVPTSAVPGSDAGSAAPSVGPDAGASASKDDGGCSVQARRPRLAEHARRPRHRARRPSWRAVAGRAVTSAASLSSTG